MPARVAVDPLVLGDGRRTARGTATPTPRAGCPVGSPCSSRSTTPPGDVEVAARARERRGVEPQRVVVLRPRAPRASLPSPRRARLPSAAARPSRRSRQPVPRIQVPLARLRRGRASSASASVATPSSRTSRCASDQRREVDVRVGERREDAAAAQVDDDRASAAPTRACRRRRPRGHRRSRARRATGSDASIVRTTPLSRIMAATVVEPHFEEAR